MMFIRKSLFCCALAALLTLVSACNNRAWYEGMQGSARKECQKDGEPCPDAPDYDRYKQERDTLKK